VVYEPDAGPGILDLVAVQLVAVGETRERGQNYASTPSMAISIANEL